MEGVKSAVKGKGRRKELVLNNLCGYTEKEDKRLLPLLLFKLILDRSYALLNPV